MSKSPDRVPRGSFRSRSLTNGSRFPPLPATSQHSAPTAKSTEFAGVQGSALSVPPPKAQKPAAPTEQRPSLDRDRDTQSSLTTANGTSPAVSSRTSETDLLKVAELEKELDQLRGELKRTKVNQRNVTVSDDAVLQNSEKKLRCEVADLKEALTESQEKVEGHMTLQMALNEQVVSLKAQLVSSQNQAEESTRRYSEERDRHKVTGSRLDRCEKDIAVLKNELKNEQDSRVVQLERLNRESEEKIRFLTESKDALISDLEAKVKRLKMHMADALKGNSWERQQQLDELTKELQKVHDENDALRTKLKHGPLQCLQDRDAEVAELRRQLDKTDQSERRTEPNFKVTRR